jgi:uncharacterized membrane protein YczE
VRLLRAPRAMRSGRPGHAIRTAQLLFGLFLFGLSIALMIRAELGLGPWDAFHVGLSRVTGISVGLIIIAIGFVVVLSALLIRVRPGPGTLANMIMVGIFADLLLPVIPVASGVSWSWAFLFSGIALCGLATGIYIGAGYGAGPRDSLMVGIAERSGWSIRRVRTLIEVSVLGLGWMMGGKIGIGTVVFTLTIGPSAQWGMRLFAKEAAA